MFTRDITWSRVYLVTLPVLRTLSTQYSTPSTEYALCTEHPADSVALDRVCRVQSRVSGTYRVAEYGVNTRTRYLQIPAWIIQERCAESSTPEYLQRIRSTAYGVLCTVCPQGTYSLHPVPVSVLLLCTGQGLWQKELQHDPSTPSDAVKTPHRLPNSFGSQGLPAVVPPPDWPRRCSPHPLLQR